jgi:hypothetical protein
VKAKKVFFFLNLQLFLKTGSKKIIEPEIFNILAQNIVLQKLVDESLLQKKKTVTQAGII